MLFRSEQNQEANAHLTSRQIFIREIRNRIEAYFKLIVRNLRDSIPKSIGYNLVLSIQENMQMHLYDALYKSQEIVAALNEPEGIKRQREELTRQIRVMKDAQKVIRRDPDLMSVMNIDISDNEISEHGNRKKSLLDFVFRGVFAHAKHLVIISFCHNDNVSGGFY